MNGSNPVTLRDYWWAWATEPESGRLIVLGWYNSENEAYQDAIGKMQGIPFEVVPLKTRDRTYAKAKLNYIRLERYSRSGYGQKSKVRCTQSQEGIIVATTFSEILVEGGGICRTLWTGS